MEKHFVLCRNDSRQADQNDVHNEHSGDTCAQPVCVCVCVCVQLHGVEHSHLLKDQAK